MAIFHGGAKEGIERLLILTRVDSQLRRHEAGVLFSSRDDMLFVDAVVPGSIVVKTL